MLYRSQIGDIQNPAALSFPERRYQQFSPFGSHLDILTALCDELLNVGDRGDRGFEFRPIFPFVDLEILHYPKMEYGLFPPAGFISQHECYVRIFVMKYIALGEHWFGPTAKFPSSAPCSLSSNRLVRFCRPGCDRISRNCSGASLRSRHQPVHHGQDGGISRALRRARSRLKPSSRLRRPAEAQTPSDSPLGNGLGGISMSSLWTRPPGRGEVVRFLSRGFRMCDDETISGRDAPFQRLLPGDPPIIHLRRIHRRSRSAAADADHAQRLPKLPARRQPWHSGRSAADADFAVPSRVQLRIRRHDNPVRQR